MNDKRALRAQYKQNIDRIKLLIARSGDTVPLLNQLERQEGLLRDIELAIDEEASIEGGLLVEGEVLVEDDVLVNELVTSATPVTGGRLVDYRYRNVAQRIVNIENSILDLKSSLRQLDEHARNVDSSSLDLKSSIRELNGQVKKIDVDLAVISVQIAHIRESRAVPVVAWGTIVAIVVLAIVFYLSVFVLVQ